MDGYAFAHRDCAGRDKLPLSQTIYAGAKAPPLQASSCARVFTGSLLPQGADTVVVQENVTRDKDVINFIQPVPARGTHVRQAASIYAHNDTLIEAGRALWPQHISLLASAGIARVKVKKRPRVALLSTGDELVQLGPQVTGGGAKQPPLYQADSLQPWQSIDSNQLQIATLFQQLGCMVVCQMHVPDSQDLLVNCMQDAASDCDLLLTCGGASVGDRDYLHQAIAKLGEVNIWKISIRPGKPFLFGWIDTQNGTKPVLGLPGNPLSALITSLMLVRPFLGGMLDLPFHAISPPTFRIPCDFSFSGDARRTLWLQVTQHGEKLQLAGKQLSDQLSCAAQASGVAMLEPGQNISPGQTLPYIPYSSLLHW